MLLSLVAFSWGVVVVVAVAGAPLLWESQARIDKQRRTGAVRQPFAGLLRGSRTVTCAGGIWGLSHKRQRFPPKIRLMQMPSRPAQPQRPLAFPENGSPPRFDRGGWQSRASAAFSPPRRFRPPQARRPKARFGGLWSEAPRLRTRNGN